MKITDSNIRAAVWPDELGRWWAVVYHARRRVDFARPAWRVAVDRDHSRERVVRVFDGRLEALNWARWTVGELRVQLALADFGKRSTYSTEQFAAAWAARGQVGLERTADDADVMYPPLDGRNDR